MVEIDVKDDFLLKNKVLPSKNVTFVYKGKYPKIQRKIRHKFVLVIIILLSLCSGKSEYTKENQAQICFGHCFLTNKVINLIP